MRMTTVFLDAGGVLVFPNWARVAAALAEQGVQTSAETLSVAEPRAKRRLDTDHTVQSSDDAKRGWWYFNLILEEAGVALSAATDAALEKLHEYHRTENLWELVPADVAPTLDRLRAAGLQLVVVSNANGRLRHLFERLDLATRVDVLFDSFEEGVEKPDPRLFEIALARSGATRETTVHVGDLYHVDVVGARAAGLQAVLIDPARLYDGIDCPRIHALPELCDVLELPADCP